MEHGDNPRPMRLHGTWQQSSAHSCNPHEKMVNHRPMRPSRIMVKMIGPYSLYGKWWQFSTHATFMENSCLRWAWPSWSMSTIPCPYTDLIFMKHPWGQFSARTASTEHDNSLSIRSFMEHFDNCWPIQSSWSLCDNYPNVQPWWSMVTVIGPCGFLETLYNWKQLAVLACMGLFYFVSLTFEGEHEWRWGKNELASLIQFAYTTWK